MTEDYDSSGNEAEAGGGATWRDVLRPFVHGARRLVYRLMHPWRRRRAVRLVRTAAPVGSVAFICLGNICRSPYAAVAATARLESRGVRVLSAGLLRGGRPSPLEAVEAARERGVDLESHTSRGVEGGLLEDVDLVVVMDPRQKRALLDRRAARRDRILVLGDLDPSMDGGRRTIPDPWGQDLPAFREVYDRIDRCMDVLYREMEAAAAPHSRGARGSSSSKKNRVP